MTDTHTAAIRRWALARQNHPYLYGATGTACTPQQRRARMTQYPAQAEAIRAACPVLTGERAGCQGCRHHGKDAYDCAQFVRRAFETAGIQLPSGASSQWRWTGWAHKGPITPEAGQRVCALFRQGADPQRPMDHVGLSLGDGRVMDARSHSRGVVLGKLNDYPWTHWAVPAGAVLAPATLRPGSRGDAVKALQQLLLGRGYALPRHGADGVFGPETQAAVRAARQRLGLPAGDTADDALLTALRAQPAPKPAPPTVDERLSALERRMAQVERQIKEAIA